MHVDDFPAEILIHIFEQAKSSAPFAVGGSTLTILISQVCATWRSIALDSAALWNDLRLSSGSSPFQLDQLFARSKESLVSITADFRGADTPLHQYWELLKALTAYSARIYALYVIAPIHVLSMLSRVVIGHEFPRLARLQVVQEFVPIVSPKEEIVFAVPPWRISVDSPQLESLSITATTPTRHEQFNRLQELHVESSGYFVHSSGADGSMGTPLTHFLGLKMLSITSSPLPSLPVCPADTQIVSLTLANLRTADIPSGILTHFLDTLRMPNLQSLVIRDVSGHLWDELVRSLADARYPALRSVVFDSLALTGIDERCFRAFASVSTLRLLNVDPQPVVRILKSDTRICPAVRSIDLGGLCVWDRAEEQSGTCGTTYSKDTIALLICVLSRRERQDLVRRKLWVQAPSKEENQVVAKRYSESRKPGAHGKGARRVASPPPGTIYEVEMGV
ncbi:hypothetical protein C8R44DRAFT_746896 [Mycena epipterygia]|nr:hypothetical protein C8R44DRAFT_746896 [Mycena epipterygia]